MKNLSPTLLSLVLLTAACGGGGSADEATLQAAGQLHLQASEVQERIEPLIDSLALLKTQLTAKQTPEAQATVAEIDSVTKRFEEWEDTAVEVPGQEHPHQHGEGEHHHHHDHKPAPQVTASEMLDIQKELKANIEKIDRDVRATLDKGRAAL